MMTMVMICYIISLLINVPEQPHDSNVEFNASSVSTWRSAVVEKSGGVVFV